MSARPYSCCVRKAPPCNVGTASLVPCRHGLTRALPGRPPLCSGGPASVECSSFTSFAVVCATFQNYDSSLGAPVGGAVGGQPGRAVARLCGASALDAVHYKRALSSRARLSEGLTHLVQPCLVQPEGLTPVAALSKVTPAGSPLPIVDFSTGFTIIEGMTPAGSPLPLLAARTLVRARL